MILLEFTVPTTARAVSREKTGKWRKGTLEAAEPVVQLRFTFLYFFYFIFLFFSLPQLFLPLCRYSI